MRSVGVVKRIADVILTLQFSSCDNGGQADRCWLWCRLRLMRMLIEWGESLVWALFLFWVWDSWAWSKETNIVLHGPVMSVILVSVLSVVIVLVSVSVH